MKKSGKNLKAPVSRKSAKRRSQEANSGNQFSFERFEPRTMMAADVIVSPLKGLKTSEDGGYAVVSFVLTQKPNSDVTIPLSSSNPREGLPTQSAVVFTPANWNLVQSVRVDGVTDGVKDKNVKYNLITGDAISTDSAFSGLEIEDPQLTNMNSRLQVAGYTISKTSGLTTSEDGGTTSFNIHLNFKPKANVTISIASDNPQEGLTDVSQLVFTPDNFDQPQTVTITGVPDGVKDGTKNYTIVTGAAVSSDPLYNGMAIQDVKVKNQDTKFIEPIAVTPSQITLPNSDSTAAFYMVLKSQPTASVTIPIWSSNAAAGQPTVSSVTFTPADWNVPKTLTFARKDNGLANRDIAYSIVTGTTTSADPRFNGINPADIQVTNKAVSGIARFNGNYSGAYYGTAYYQGQTIPVESTPITVKIQNGVVFVNGQNAGTLASSGTLAFAMTSGSYRGATFSGNLSPDGDFGMKGKGTWQYVEGQANASGFWNITRVSA